MPKPVPIFREHGETYLADSCQPLVAAAARGEVRLVALARGHYPGKRLPHGVLSGIKTAGFWDAKRDQTWGLPWHRNEGIELTFLESGRLTFEAEGRQFTLLPGDLTITRPWQRHRVGQPHVSAGRLHWVILDVKVRRPNQAWKWPSWVLLSRPDIEELTNILRHCEGLVWRGSAEIRRSIRGIAQAIDEDRRGSSISRLAVRFNELLVSLLDLLRGENVELDASLSGSRRTVQLFLEDLRAHEEHLEMAWSVQDMATACGLGVTRFVHHVRALTNMTPIECLNHYRLEHGARLLRERPHASILDVALACGFASSQYFATSFSRRFGQTPSHFREVNGRCER